MPAQTSRSRATTLPLALTLLTMIFATQAEAQWDIQDSHTTASLRGIASVDGAIAWASGTGGTVLHTTDGGANWQRCTTPPGAENLDFRGIQAFDANTAIVMSSGKGDLSRLYKTTDACQTWKLLFTNPDKEGFWDALKAHIALPSDTQICSSKTSVITGAIFGDPAVHKSNQWDTTTHPSFYLATFTVNSSCSPDKLDPSATGIFSGPEETAFAASNSVLYQLGPNTSWIATDREVIQYGFGITSPHKYDYVSVCGIDVPLQRGEPSQGVFSFAIRPGSIEQPKTIKWPLGPYCLKADIVAVGGDYLAPGNSEKTGAFTAGGKKFRAAQTPPHGYRSAVAYDANQKLWITVGPNGTDISTDDGRNWTPLKPSTPDPPDADKNWNALSLPYVVGPKGRIGKLRPINPSAKEQPKNKRNKSAAIRANPWSQQHFFVFASR